MCNKRQRSNQNAAPELHHKSQQHPAGNHMFKVNYRNTRTRCEICSELTIKTSERRDCSVSNVNFEQVNASWE